MHARYNGTYPTCRPSARAAAAAPSTLRAQSNPSGRAGSATAAANNTGPRLPSLSDAHTRHVPVLKFVPKELRQLWSQCVSRACANAQARNDAAAWTELQMLTKCTLCAPPRAGKEHANQRLAFTRARLLRWLDGERATLWQDVPRSRAKSHTRAMSAQAEQALRQQRCIDHCASPSVFNNIK